MIGHHHTEKRDESKSLQVQVQDYLYSPVKSCQKACLGVGGDVERKENTCKIMRLASP